MNAKRLSQDIGWMLMFSVFFTGTAHGGLTDLANQPLVTSTTGAVLPNLLFLLDDSGSMSWAHMPDDASDPGTSVTWSYGYYGLRSSQCNGVYYNPDITYTPPVKADGTSYDNASFTAALPDGYKAAGGDNAAIDLSSRFRAEGDASDSAAYYYAYTGSQTTAAQRDYNSTTNTFYRECHSAKNADPGEEVFTKVTVTGATQQQNFANWYSYYRTRMLMMKTAMGQAFSKLDNHYRVGFMALNQSAKFLDMAAFDSSQKSAWYTNLYSIDPTGDTPLRKVLSDAGRFYAGKREGAHDPVQYSCQQNFTIMSTDGYWNAGGDAVNLAVGYQLDGTTTVGNQDGSAARPYYDGSTTVTTTTTPTTTVDHKKTVTTTTTTTPWTRKSYTLASCTFFSGGRPTAGKRRQYTEQQYLQTQVTTVTQLFDVTTTTNHIVKTSNGTVISDTTEAAPGSPSTTYGSSSTTSSDTGTPGESTTWTNGSSGTEGGCSASTTLPSPNPSAATSSTATTTSSSATTTISTDGPTQGTPQVSTQPVGGSTDSLADVAYYYYLTDLRTSDLGNCTGALGNGTDVCANNVPASGKDSTDAASWQHMTLFTIGLGASGRMAFSSSYLTDTSGDYASVKNGTTANPPSVCSWQASGSGACNWPIPGFMDGTTDGKIENIDDLWHAAVNGRGTYSSATNATSLATALNNALSNISSRNGSASAAATSNPNITTGDNYVFSSTFTTVSWDGELIRQQMDVATGEIPVYNPKDASTYDWTARDQLDANTSRTLYTYDASSASHLKSFAWSSLNGTEQAYFSLDHISSLSQFCTSGTGCLDSASKTNAAGENLVKFLAGDRTYEDTITDTSHYYRQRTHLLGDIVNADVVYVKAPLYSYADPGYGSFVTAQSSRTAMVYAAANDGMLHAFNGSNGSEAWAYIPSLVLPNLYKLADKNYANLHSYFVDGSPVVGDICVSNCDSNANAVWKTILVGGLRGGGRGYYALDITTPASPKVLWEFTDDNLGYTYGNPVITKLENGTWVVIFASGYNNVSPGDGKGHLYVLNANTGAAIDMGGKTTIDTGIGDTSTPSGLARINAWVANGSTNNTALRVYGGDLLGNLWRFDINGDVGASGYDAQLLATLKDASGNAQPITVRPELGQVSGNAVIYVGTGKYLGMSDITDTSQQSFYAIKDALPTDSTPSTAIYDNPRSITGFIAQLQRTTTCPEGMPATVCSAGQNVHTGTNNAVNFATDKGWYFDFADSGERDNTDPLLAFGTLLFNTNVPTTSSACMVGGYSYRYFVDYRTGGPVASAIGTGGTLNDGTPGTEGTPGTPSTAGTTGAKLDNSLASSPNIVILPNGTVISITNMSNNVKITNNIGDFTVSSNTRRVSWRELINE